MTVNRVCIGEPGVGAIEGVRSLAAACWLLRNRRARLSRPVAAVGSGTSGGTCCRPLKQLGLRPTEFRPVGALVRSQRNWVIGRGIGVATDHRRMLMRRAPFSLGRATTKVEQSSLAPARVTFHPEAFQL